MLLRFVHSRWPSLPVSPFYLPSASVKTGCQLQWWACSNLYTCPLDFTCKIIAVTPVLRFHPRLIKSVAVSNYLRINTSQDVIKGLQSESLASPLLQNPHVPFYVPPYLGDNYGFTMRQAQGAASQLLNLPAQLAPALLAPKQGPALGQESQGMWSWGSPHQWFNDIL